MKKRVLPILLSLCLMASMLPTALAVDTDTPSAEQISISAEGSSTPMTSVPDGQALRMDIPNDVVLDLGSIGMTTNMAVTLGNVPTSDSNTIYADGTNLKIALSVKGASYKGSQTCPSEPWPTNWATRTSVWHLVYWWRATSKAWLPRWG